MRFRCTSSILAATVTLSLLAAGTATAQQDFGKVYEKVKQLQVKGKHQQALKLIDQKLKGDESPVALVLKATSLAGTERAAEAFRLLVPVKDRSEVTLEVQRIGKLLPEHEVKVRSEPEGATVVVDNNDMGKTPLDAKLTPGFHDLVLRLDGYGSSSATIFVDPDQTGYHAANLTAETGSVLVEVDQEGLRVKVGGVEKALGMGKTKVEAVPAGEQNAVFVGPDGKEVHTATVNVKAGGEAALMFSKFGVIKSKFDDATVELVPEADDDEKEEGASKDKPKSVKELRLEAGQYTVLLKRPGYYPLKGKLDVKAGQEQTLLSELDPVPDRSQVEIWSVVGISLSLAMIATATVLELSDVAEEGGGSAAKFTVAGVGGALFVTSGALLKWVRDEKTNPSPKEGSFEVKLGAGFGDGLGFVSATGSF